MVQHIRGCCTVALKCEAFRKQICSCQGITGVTEYFDPPENPGPGPHFREKMGPSHTKDILFFTR